MPALHEDLRDAGLLAAVVRLVRGDVRQLGAAEAHAAAARAGRGGRPTGEGGGSLAEIGGNVGDFWRELTFQISFLIWGNSDSQDHQRLLN